MIIPFNNKTKSFRSIITIINPIKPHLKIEIEALWDTGAVTSTVPEYYAKLLQLQSIGGVLTKGNNGACYQNRYFANFELDGQEITIYPNSNNLDFALIGMDIISKGETCIKKNNNGILTMYFDFV